METFQFFDEYLPKINQSQLKYSNYSVLLCAWLVSMEICPKGIFNSIWHLPVQIKVLKENIIPKRETSEAHSEPCKTSKMKLFAKILDSFQLLTIALIA